MKKIFFVALAIFLYGCNTQAQRRDIEINNHKFSLEIAKTQEQRAFGLQNRKSLDPDNGMLFEFSDKSNLSFWMKNTHIPLQIIFVDGCKVVDQQEMTVEENPENPVKHYISKYPADKAIELNANSVHNLIGTIINDLCIDNQP